MVWRKMPGSWGRETGRMPPGTGTTGRSFWGRPWLKRGCCANDYDVVESKNERCCTPSPACVLGVCTGKILPLPVRSESETYLRLLELQQSHATPEHRCLGVRPLLLPKLVNLYRFSRRVSTIRDMRRWLAGRMPPNLLLLLIQALFFIKCRWLGSIFLLLNESLLKH